jgi:hypothetical protein
MPAQLKSWQPFDTGAILNAWRIDRASFAFIPILVGSRASFLSHAGEVAALIEEATAAAK